MVKLAEARLKEHRRPSEQVSPRAGLEVDVQKQ
jgi:hypothetical protein